MHARLQRSRRRPAPPWRHAAATPPRRSLAFDGVQATRQKAAVSLVDGLLKEQKEFEVDLGAEQSEDDNEDAAQGGGAAADRALRRCCPHMASLRP